MRKVLLLLIAILSGVNAFAANGNLSVNGTINTGSGGINFQDGTIQKTAAFQVLSADMAIPGTNDFTITIPPTAGKINLSYTIIPSVDAEPIMLGFNDNLTATGSYALYGVGTYSATAGKVQAGYARTAAGSAGQYNSYDIIPSGNLVLFSGDNISESNVLYWAAFFKGYLKYDSPQAITKINLKCFNPGTIIYRIDWKVVTLP